MISSTSVKSISFFINGEWTKPSGRATLPDDPARRGLAEVPLASADDIDYAVETAHQGYLKCARCRLSESRAVLYRYKALLEAHHTDLAQLLTSENGKTLTIRCRSAARHPDGGVAAGCHLDDGIR